MPTCWTTLATRRSTGRTSSTPLVTAARNCPMLRGRASSPSFDQDFITNANGSFNTSDGTTFATGSKDTLPITGGWECNFDNNVNSKSDVMNAYACPIPIRSPKTNSLLRARAQCQHRHRQRWLLVPPGEVGCELTSGSTPFTGDHVDGDLLIVSEFSNGGAVSTIFVYRWERRAAAHAQPRPCRWRNENVDCDIVTGGDSICANVNLVSITTPWPTANKRMASATRYETQSSSKPGSTSRTRVSAASASTPSSPTPARRRR